MRTDPRQKVLEEIALGDIDPSIAFPLIRELLVEDAPRFGKRVYLALQDVIWRLVSDRKMDDEAIQWLDVCGRASMMLRQGGEEPTGHRVAALGDLIERAIQFFQNQPLDEVLARRHVSEVLTALQANKACMSRSAILEATGLGQSNLTRVLKLLQAHGLVVRSKSGREADIALTEQGVAAIARLSPSAGAQVDTETLKNVSRVGLTVSTVESGVAYANDAFHAIAGMSADDAFSLAGKEGVEDLMTAKDRWLRRLDIGQVDAGKLSVWVDVSDLRFPIDQAGSHISKLNAQIAGLKQQLALAQAEVSAREQHLQRERQAVNFLRERTVGRLSSVADLVRRGEPNPLLGLELDEMARNKGLAAKTPDVHIVEVRNAIDRLLRVEAAPDQPHAGLRRGPDVVGEIVKSISTLSETKYAFHPPQWTEDVNLGAFARPLGHVLLGVEGDLDVEIFEDAGYIVVAGHNLDADVQVTIGEYASILEEAKISTKASDAWSDNGVSVQVFDHDGGGKVFNLAMPKSSISATDYLVMEDAHVQQAVVYNTK